MAKSSDDRGTEEQQRPTEGEMPLDKAAIGNEDANELIRAGDGEEEAAPVLTEPTALPSIKVSQSRRRYAHLNGDSVGDQQQVTRQEETQRDELESGEEEEGTQPHLGRHSSVRRKSSFQRVRRLFEAQKSRASVNRQLTRPLSVNLPYTAPIEMAPADGDLQRTHSNEDLTRNSHLFAASSATLRFPLSKRLSTSSTCMNDIYIIPSKTVYENVRFFESKSKQSTASLGLHTSARHSKSATDEVQSRLGASESTRKIRFGSQSADDILEGGEEENVVASVTADDQVHEERSINDLFNNLYDRLHREQQSAPQFVGDTRRSTRTSERNRSCQSVASQTDHTLSMASADDQSTAKLDLLIQIHSTTNSRPVHLPSSGRRKAPSAIAVCGRGSHRLRRSKRSASESTRSLTVQLSSMKLNDVASPSTSSKSAPTASSQQQFQLRLSPAALRHFSTRLRRFCKHHSAATSPSLVDKHSDQQVSQDDNTSQSVSHPSPPSPPPSPPTVRPNALHRDSLVTNGHKDTASGSSRWKDRRKAVYRRNLSLGEYLHRNLLNPEGGMLKFQSEYPWRTFIQSGRHSNRLSELGTQQIRLYESLFEIILTEKTYLLQLEKLSNFTETYPQIKAVTSIYDRNLLFGNVAQLYAANQALFSEFESAFQLDIFMESIVDILERYLTSGRLEPYIDYIKGQDDRNRLITEKQSLFQSMMMAEAAKLNSLLIVPMQRITRYPLLVKNILDQVDKLAVKQPTAQLPDREPIERCYTAATLFATKCNTALENERKLGELIRFKQQIAGGMRINDLVAANRQIVLKAAVKVQRRICFKSSNNNQAESTIKDMKLKATVILLNDMVILTEFKAKKNHYIVLDFEKLERIEFRSSELSPVAHSSALSFNNSLTMDVDSLDTISLSQFVPLTTPTTPQTPHLSSVLRFSKDHCTNIYIAAFTSSDEEDKFVGEFKRLKQEYLERLNQEPTLRSHSPRQSNGTNRLSTLSTNSNFYYSDGDSRSTNSSDIDYFTAS